MNAILNIFLILLLFFFVGIFLILFCDKTKKIANYEICLFHIYITGHGDNKHSGCEYKEAQRFFDERMRVP